MNAPGYSCFGLELTGPRKHRSTVVEMDYLPEEKRLIIRAIHTPKENPQGEDPIQSFLKDFKLNKKKKTQLCIHAPLSLPPILKSPSLKKQDSLWLQKNQHAHKNIYLDYLHRPFDVYLRDLCKEKFNIQDAFSANSAPIALRAYAMKKELQKFKALECPVRANLQRICRSIGSSSNDALNYSRSLSGEKTRKKILNRMNKNIPQFFVYDENKEVLIKKLPAFNAFICALTSFLVLRKKIEVCPKNFPKSSWGALIKKDFFWT